MTVRIHDRYLLARFIRVFFFSVLAFTVIYITIDTFEEIDNFIDHDASIKDIFLFYFYSTPFALTYIIPVSMLLATIFSMGILARRNELTALLASGISLVRLATPILILAVFVSIGSTYFNDMVVTKANRLANQVKRVNIEGKQPENPNLKDNFHYLGEHGFVYLAKRYNHVSMTLFEVVVQQFDNNTLTRRIDARRATWEKGQWVFKNGFDRSFVSGSEAVSTFMELSLSELAELPDDFAKKEVDQDNMNTRELSAFIRKIRRSGGKIERYETDLYAKFNYPLVGSIFVLIGIAFASGRRKQSIATGFGVTLVVSFMYYVALKLGQTLGYNSVLPPILAAGLGNIIFLGLGIGLIVRANQ
jgi:lipopolysaccharide export system permease protein